MAPGEMRSLRDLSPSSRLISGRPNSRARWLIVVCMCAFTYRTIMMLRIRVKRKSVGLVSGINVYMNYVDDCLYATNSGDSFKLVFVISI